MNQQLIIFACFFFALGACIGSFLNVVIWRLPHSGMPVTFAGKSQPLTLSWPPSHCPHCDSAIHWYQNIPILAWLFLRGKCASCHATISIRYPLIELATGLLFLAFFLAYFVAQWTPGITQLPTDLPPYLLHIFLIAALLAASAIDADFFIIPLGIPTLIALVGFAATPFIASPAIFYVDPQGGWALPTLGGMIGWIIALLLLKMKLLPQSFAQEREAEVTDQHKTRDKNGKNDSKGGNGGGKGRGKDEKKRGKEAERRDKKTLSAAQLAPLPTVTRWLPSMAATMTVLTLIIVLWLTTSAKWASLGTVFGGILIFLLGVIPRDPSTQDVTDEVLEEISAPHARLEVLKEALFIAFPIMGAMAAAMIPNALPQADWLARLLGAMLGFLVGGGTVWLTRIGGTLLFGREAMGLGDVHLLAAVGVIVGPTLVLMTFFMAPFLGILFWAVVLVALRKPAIMPYGPWLSIAAICSLLIGNPLWQWYLARLG